MRGGVPRVLWVLLAVAGCATASGGSFDEDVPETVDLDPAPDVALEPENDVSGLVFDIVAFDTPEQPLDAGLPDVGRPDADLRVDLVVPNFDELPVTATDLGAARESAVCPLGTVACGPRCANLAVDPSNCGRCGVACAPGESCAGGFCVAACPAPRMQCGAVCTDTAVDPSNCGRCANACAAGSVCTAGSCVARCPAPRTVCPDGCVDLERDPRNCGSCGSACPSGATCVAGLCEAPCPAPRRACGGVCVDVQSDPANCGACANRCATGRLCRSGVCQAASVGEVGSACGRSAECPGGFCFPGALGWLGGYCSRGGCTSDLECGPRGLCASDGTNNFCLQQCFTRADCRAGYTCLRLTTGSACIPSCLSDATLVCAPMQCNPVTEVCVDTCRVNSDCSPGSVCRAGSCACTATTNCGPGRRCNTLTGECGCASNTACGPDGICNVSTGGCAIR